jgi:tetratricopeptide (TPR) repeat protein
VFSANHSLRHLAFFESLAAHGETEAPWRAAMAGLVVLRLVDSWLEDGAEVMADAWGVKAVRSAVERADDGSPVKAILGSVVDAMSAAKNRQPQVVVPRLMAYAKALEYDAKWALAADVYQSVIGHTHPVQESDTAIMAHLQLAVCLRTLGRLQEAHAAYTTAGVVAEQSGDMMGVLRARIGDAKIAVAKGNLPHAAAVLDETIAKAALGGVSTVHSMALHDRAVVAGMQGDYEMAIRFAYDALRESTVPMDRDRILHDIGSAFLELGVRSAARDAFLVLSATASEQYVRWGATLKLMSIAAEDSSQPVFEQSRRELASAALPPELETVYYTQLGLAYRQLEQEELSQIALTKAIELAERYGYNRLLFQAEHALAEVPKTRVRKPEEIPSSVGDIAEAVRSMRELAVAQ